MLETSPAKVTHVGWSFEELCLSLILRSFFLCDIGSSLRSSIKSSTTNLTTKWRGLCKYIQGTVECHLLLMLNT